MSGKVILVGAGPGDPGLITVKGQSVLESADVVVYDRLVGEGILNRIPDTAERINVGKASSNHLVPQERINEMLVEKAKQGKTVVRLKGGDPFVFGRGGEELELLSENGIEYEVIPGITSAIAGPAYAGIPVTHRDFCSSMHIITGHARAGKAPDLRFEALVECGGTMVFVMGVSAVGYICDGLINAGMPEDTPAAVVENGTLPVQRHVLATVSTLESKAREAAIHSPALIIVGKVCALSEKFGWFERAPLFGKTVLVTRPKERAGTLSAKLRALGAQVIELPCIETRIIKDNSALLKAVSAMDKYKWLAFTSPAGVDAVMESLFSAGLDVRAFAAVKLAAIGSATGAQLRRYGLSADLIPEVYDAENLGKALVENCAENVLILRARDGSPELTAALDLAGISYDDIPVYTTSCCADVSDELRSMLQSGAVDAVTFTSASTVRGFSGCFPDGDFSGLTGICIGQQTAAEAEKYGIKRIVSQRATIDSLVEALVTALTEE